MFRRFSKRLLLLAALSSVTILLWPVTCLTARSDGKLLFAWPIRAGESFEVTFMHSLNLSPVTDVIEWTGSDLVVRKSVFYTFGAGIPSPSDGVGTELIFMDGRYELVGIDTHMQNFAIMTQDIPNHRIILGGREAFLLQLAGSGQLIVIEVRQIPLVVRLLPL